MKCVVLIIAENQEESSEYKDDPISIAENRQATGDFSALKYASVRSAVWAIGHTDDLDVDYLFKEGNELYRVRAR